MNCKNIKVFHPSPHLLKVTKFLLKISQFEFLVTTEQRILVCKLFSSLKIPDFSLFLSKNCNPPEKSHSPISQHPTLKTEVLLSPPPHFENLVGGSTPARPPAEKGGGCTLWVSIPCEIRSKLTIKIPERSQGARSGVFIVNFEQIWYHSSVSIVEFKQVNAGGSF